MHALNTETRAMIILIPNVIKESSQLKIVKSGEYMLIVDEDGESEIISIDANRVITVTGRTTEHVTIVHGVDLLPCHFKLPPVQS